MRATGGECPYFPYEKKEAGDVRSAGWLVTGVSAPLFSVSLVSNWSQDGASLVQRSLPIAHFTVRVHDFTQNCRSDGSYMCYICRLYLCRPLFLSSVQTQRPTLTIALEVTWTWGSKAWDQCLKQAFSSLSACWHVDVEKQEQWAEGTSTDRHLMGKQKNELKPLKNTESCSKCVWCYYQVNSGGRCSLGTNGWRGDAGKDTWHENIMDSERDFVFCFLKKA